MRRPFLLRHLEPVNPSLVYFQHTGLLDIGVIMALDPMNIDKILGISELFGDLRHITRASVQPTVRPTAHTGDVDPNSLSASEGNNIFYGLGGNDTITGGKDSDQILGDDGNDSLDGGDASDYIDGGLGADTIIGGLGNDILDGSYGFDSILGGDGDDNIQGNFGADTLLGGNGIDTLFGFSGNDSIIGGAGNDTIFGMGDNDYANGGAGADAVLGGRANDSLYGAAGNDTIRGETGDDYVSGGAGSDSLFGGAGNDTIAGGQGADSMYGGAGADTYIIEALPSGVTSIGTTRIYGFEAGEHIDLSILQVENTELMLSYLTGGTTATVYDNSTATPTVIGYIEIIGEFIDSTDFLLYTPPVTPVI